MTVSRKRAWKGYAATASKAMKFATQHGGKIMSAYKYFRRGSFTKDVRKRGSKETGDISRYHEDKMIYRRKRAPARIRKRARANFNNVRRQVMAMHPLKVLLRGYLFTETWTPSNAYTQQHLCTSIMINGYSQTIANPNYGDYWTLLNTEGSTAQVKTGIRLEVKSVCLDITLFNNEAYAMYVDIYYVTARKNNSVNELPDIDFSGGLVNLASPVGVAVSSGAALGSTNFLGMTPFQVPSFCEMWLITKKRRVYLDALTPFNFQIRDSKAREIASNYPWYDGYKAIKGVTQGVMMVGTAVGTVSGSNNPAGSLQVQATKTYNYKVGATEYSTGLVL